MGYDRIAGHREAIGLLRKAMNRHRLAHGYIFEGVPGSGRRLVARELSKALLCDLGGEEGCGECASCLKFDTSNHPDYLEIAPEGKSVKVEQVESLQEFLLTRPYVSDRKVVVVDEAETMTVSAQNRLLKLVEEPPAYATLIFIATSADALLPTILSRCQVISFGRLEPEVIQTWLMREKGLDEIVAQTASLFADGSMARALMLATSESFAETRAEALELIGIFMTKEPLEGLLKLQKYCADKVMATSLTDLMIIWYRDLSALSIDPEQAVIFNGDCRKKLLEMTNPTYNMAWLDCIDIIEDTARAFEENANTSLAMYAMALRIQEVFHDNSRRGPV
jgi:DNA polymerase-3 subunit delta'